MVGNSSQRTAWNKAMGLPTTANSNIGKKRLRREKKLTFTQSMDDGGNSKSNQQDMDYPNILRFDRLERGGQVNFALEDEDDGDDIGFYGSTTTHSKKRKKDDNDDEDEYDDLEELEGKVHGKKKTNRGSKRKQDNIHKLKSKDTTTIPKWMKIRTLSSILIEESTRSDDGILKQYLEAEATEHNIIYPKKQFCPVTGLLGIYKDPKTGLPYATLSALEQIHERVPPWLSGAGGGSTLYHETVNSLRVMNAQNR